MKNETGRGNCLFDIVLMLVNSIGIVGALTEILAIRWREPGAYSFAKGGSGLDYRVFWGGVVVFCIAAVLVRSGPSGKSVLKRVAVCAILYLILGIVFREILAGGFSLAFEDTVENLNARYEFHIVRNASRLRETMSWKAGMRTCAVTGSILYALFPLEILAGVLGRYDKGFCLILGNALWFTAACICDIFPGFFFLTFCVLGAVAVLVRKDFVRSPGAGFAVVCCAGGLSGLVMLAVFYFFLPVMDRQYEELVTRREAFYRIVNEEWIPWVKSILPRGGFGSGADVTGELGRSNFFAYTDGNVYRVTVDQKPQGALYLKGFVGGSYDGKEWQAWPDRELEEYYEAHGMELPGDFNRLVNISYEAAGALQGGTSPAHIRLEELGGRGSYSLYPYGAMLTEEYRVHGDGSVDRIGREYEFPYYFLAGIGRQDVLEADWAGEEAQYRQYVYNRYLEYPEADLPRLTNCLRAEGIRTDSVYTCALDLIHFLGNRASYNLDAENNPPGTDFVEYFLFDSREGYCMHFASAAVLAMRYYGIPARYVAGYTVSPSDFSPGTDGTYTAVITGRQAHAWAEVYLDAIGWVPLEATPGAVAFPEDNRMELLGQLGQLSGEGLMLAENDRAWQQDRMTWQSDNAGSAEEPETMPEETGGQTETVDAESGQTDEGAEPEGNAEGTASESGQLGAGGRKTVPLPERRGFRIFMIALAIAMLFGALVCLEKWDESRRREIFRRADRRERIFLLYRNFRNVFRNIGFPGDMDVDGEAFGRILQESFRMSQAEYGEFCRILAKNSFGREAPSEEELGEIRAIYDKLIREACARAAFYKKPLIRRYLQCV